MRAARCADPHERRDSGGGGEGRPASQRTARDEFAVRAEGCAAAVKVPSPHTARLLGMGAPGKARPAAVEKGSSPLPQPNCKALAAHCKQKRWNECEKQAMAAGWLEARGPASAE